MAWSNVLTERRGNGVGREMLRTLQPPNEAVFVLCCLGGAFCACLGSRKAPSLVSGLSALSCNWFRGCGRKIGRKLLSKAMSVSPGKSFLSFPGSVRGT